MILITSNSQDRRTVEAVIQKIKPHYKDVVFYEADKVAKGQILFSTRFVGGGDVVFTYGDRIIEPEAVRAAWERRSGDFGFPMIDMAKEIYLSRERRACQSLFLQSIPTHAWLNNPYKMDALDYKLHQLQVAERFGFVIPRTIVANSWKDIAEHLPYDQILFKMPIGELAINNELKVMGAKVLVRKGDSFGVKSLPYPGIFQEFVTKKKEWRVTVVGDRVFAAAIYTHRSAKDDWRKHQKNQNLVQFKKEPFDQVVSAQCVAFLKHVGLSFGAFDFIESDDGRIVFLEVNTCGQYGWLEESLDMPISQAIADELLGKAYERDPS